MKYKITEPGWENFTGQFGSHEFQDSVSVDDLDEYTAMRLSNLVRMEDMDGFCPSSSQQAIDTQGITMPVIADKVSTMTADQPAVDAGVLHTKESLQVLADKTGIAGVRKVAEPLNVSARSINDLIAGILKKQAEDSGNPYQGLLGSSVQPSTFMVGTNEVQLGTVVQSAYAASKMTIAEWNELPAEVREKLIADEVIVLTQA